MIVDARAQEAGVASRVRVLLGPGLETARHLSARRQVTQRESAGFLEPDVPNYEPITGKQRLKWFAIATAGPMSLLVAGPLSAGWGTMLNSPEEYGPHWEGFGQRYGAGGCTTDSQPG